MKTWTCLTPLLFVVVAAVIPCNSDDTTRQQELTSQKLRFQGASGIARELPLQDQKKEPSAFMQQKLQSAQAALNGIAVANLPLIETSATELVLLSRKAEFQLMKTEEYGKQSEAFHRSAQEMLNAAKAKNLDAAALAYVQLTLNCVICHKYVRDAR
jgi:hypothetical protein